MKILRISSDLAPYIIGGIPIHAQKLSQAQTNNGHDITIFTCLPSEYSPIDNNKSQYRIINYKRNIILFGNTLCFNMLRGLIRNRHKYDIIDAHSHLFISTNLAAFVRKFFNSSPLVITNHGLRSQAVPKLFQELYLRTVAKFCFRAADAVITFTEGEKNDLIAIGANPSKIVIIPNAIDTTEFYPLDTKSSNPFTAIWVGRLCAGKGLKFAILAFESFIKYVPESILYVIGDGPYFEQAKTYILQHNLEQNIILTGRIENSEMISYYNRSSVYLMTSMSEGMPRTLLEAMACEIPVICTDIPQLVPIIEKAGIVIPKRDVDATTQALLYLSEHPDECKKLGTTGRQLIDSTYSLEKMNETTENVYRDVIQKHRDSHLH